MAGLLVDKLYNPSGVLITDMETHMSHINHNIELNAGQFVQTFFTDVCYGFSSKIAVISNCLVSLNTINTEQV